MLPIWRLGDVPIPMYSSCLLVGALLGVLLFFLLLKKDKVKIAPAGFFFLSLIALGIAYLGAGIWDGLVHSLQDGYLHISGISYLGGFVLGYPCFYFLLYKGYGKEKAGYLLDRTTPAIALMHGFGRIGCLFGGCCYGKPSSLGIGLVYPEGSVAANMYGYGTPLIPVPLIEAGFLFLLCLTLCLFLKKHRLLWYCILYGVFRFLIEFLRGDNRGTMVIMTPSQFLSICLLAFALIKILFFHSFASSALVPEGETLRTKLGEKEAKRKEERKARLRAKRHPQDDGSSSTD